MEYKKLTINMEIKKSEKANLENKKLLFLELGLIITLGIVWGAFEYTSKETNVSMLEDTTEILIEEEIIPITQDTPPPPPETPQMPVMSDLIEIVDDDILVENDIINLEDDANLGVEIIDYVEDVEEEVVEEETIPFMFVEEKPKFNGGDANEFSKWVGKNLVYPEIAKENGVQGKVILSFTLTAEGEITNIKVVRGIDPALDKEAVRVVSKSPKWEPGKQRDRAVKVQFIFPVHFQLR